MRRGERVGSSGSRSTVPNRWVAAGAVVLALLATSCRNVATVVTVNADRTAKVSFLVVPGLRNLEQLGGEKGFARLVAQIDDPDSGITAKKVDKSGGMGMLVTVEATSLEELARPYPLPAPAPPGSTLQLFDVFSVLHRNGTWRLDAVARPLSQSAPSLPSLNGGLDEATYDMSVRLPGIVEATNGVEENGGVSWTLQGNEPGRLQMRTADRGPVSPLILVVGGAVLLILVGLLFAARGKDAATATKIHKESKRFLRRRMESEGSWQEAAARTTVPSGAAASAASSAPATAPAVLYAEDYEGDESNALPVPGAGWGPAPPPGATTTGTIRPAPRPTDTSDGAGATMGPSTPVVALDRGNRLGVANDEPAGAAPAQPPGWYADPEDPSRQRFWDGVGWTEHRG